MPKVAMWRRTAYLESGRIGESRIGDAERLLWRVRESKNSLLVRQHFGPCRSQVQWLVFMGICPRWLLWQNHRTVKKQPMEEESHVSLARTCGSRHGGQSRHR